MYLRKRRGTQRQQVCSAMMSSSTYIENVEEDKGNFSQFKSSPILQDFGKIIGPKSAKYKPQICPEDSQKMSEICPKYAPKHAQNMPKTCPKRAPKGSQKGPKRVPKGSRQGPKRVPRKVLKRSQGPGSHLSNLPYRTYSMARDGSAYYYSTRNNPKAIPNPKATHKCAIAFNTCS